MHATTKPVLVAGILVLVASTACNRAPTYEWRTIEAPDRTFSVALPGVAVNEDTPTKSASGDFVLHSLRTRASENAAYGCSWWEDPSFKDRTADQILDAARDYGLSGVGGKRLSDTRLTIQGYPARDIHAIARGNTAYDNRLVVARSRLYSLHVIDVTGKRDQDNIEKFFNSLILR